MEDQKKTVSGASPCGLYLVIPENWLEPETDFFKDLRGMFLAINSSQYEKNNHVIEYRPSPDEEHDADKTEIVKTLCDTVQGQGLVFICSDMDLAKFCGADGVLVESIEDIARARRVLGAESIVGMRCGLSRRTAELALEAGVDYVSFSDPAGSHFNPSILQWWHYKTDIPCLAEGRITNNDCAFYVKSGADFIDASSYVWNHPEGVMKGIVNMAYAIDLAAAPDGRDIAANGR